MRLFVAIPLSENMKKGLLEIQNAFRRSGARGNFTKPENMHMTLAFIGEYDHPDEVLEAMNRVRFHPVEMRLNRVGAFGNLWWAGVTSDGTLDAVVRRLRAALSEAGIPFDRKPFKPHITLLRKATFPRAFDPDLIKMPKAAMTANQIVLMQSTRSEYGMVYTEQGSVSACQ